MGLIDDRARERVRKLAEEQRISQERLARTAGWGSQTTASKWLLGDQDASLDALNRLAKFFGLTLCDLIKPEAPEPADPQTATVMGLFRALSPKAQEGILSVMQAYSSQARISGAARRSVRRKTPTG